MHRSHTLIPKLYLIYKIWCIFLLLFTPTEGYALTALTFHFLFMQCTLILHMSSSYLNSFATLRDRSTRNNYIYSFSRHYHLKWLTNKKHHKLFVTQELTISRYLFCGSCNINHTSLLQIMLTICCYYWLYPTISKPEKDKAYIIAFI